MKMDAHIFIDNYNVIAGAQEAAKIRENAPWPAVRIHWRNFFKLVEGDYSPITRMFAGSLPPGNEALWQYAKDHGYDTSLLQRVVREDGRSGEQAVDEVLHAKIAGALLDFDAPQALVMVTGDGQAGEFGTSFLQQAERALRRGWNIDIWSWEAQLSGNFKNLAGRNSDKMKIFLFDRFYEAITFLREGEFHHGDGNLIRISERRVSALPVGTSR
ncbi:NYN domain-containing protein [Sphingomonas sp. Leaf33]|uniref:NYN domain-containing protein n=1 Tax=Sphingomonas sp. Leaf33 TaxID=1736215 RepID=UPI0012E30A0F|nr:NYN domain-containing protein [Sphingomonas sp. Leaf33]